MSRRHAWLGLPAGGPALSRTLDTTVPVGSTAPHRAACGRGVCVGRAPAGRGRVRAADAPGGGPHRGPRGGIRCVAGTWGSRSTSGRDSSTVRLTTLVPDAGPLAERLDRAERDDRAVAEPVAAAYLLVAARPAPRRWSTTCAARREAEGAAAATGRTAARVAPPAIYALRRVRRLPTAAAVGLTDTGGPGGTVPRPRPKGSQPGSGQVGEQVAVALDAVQHLVVHQLGEAVRLLEQFLDLVPRARCGHAGDPSRPRSSE